MTDTTSPAAPASKPSFPLLERLAAQMGKTIAFVDLEATGTNVNAPQFGITEYAYYAIKPDGSHSKFAALVNPEHPIPGIVTEITGIRDSDVSGQPPLSAHHKRLHGMLERSFIVGFNIHGYDYPALIGQFQRYSMPLPASSDSVDLRDVWCSLRSTRKGKLSEVAEHYGKTIDGAHRAMADAFACAEIMEEMLWRHGFETLFAHRRAGYDPANPEASAPTPAKAAAKAAKELDADGLALKAAVDACLASEAPPSGADFAAAIGALGWKVSVSKYGASYAKGETRLACSALGDGYSWKNIQAKLSSPIPEGQLAAPSTRFDNAAPAGAAASASAPAQAKPAGKAFGTPAAEAEAAEAAIRQAISETGRADARRAYEISGLKRFSAISFALSDMLSKGQITPESASDPASQEWLAANMAAVKAKSPDGKLKPMLAAAKELGAPESVDYVQLRVALLTGAAPHPASSAPAAPAASAPAPQAGHFAPAGPASPASNRPDAFDLPPEDLFGGEWVDPNPPKASRPGP